MDLDPPRPSKSIDVPAVSLGFRCCHLSVLVRRSSATRKRTISPRLPCRLFAVRHGPGPDSRALMIAVDVVVVGNVSCIGCERIQILTRSPTWLPGEWAAAAGRISAKRLLPEARAAGYVGSRRKLPPSGRGGQERAPRQPTGTSACGLVVR